METDEQIEILQKERDQMQFIADCFFHVIHNGVVSSKLPPTAPKGTQLPDLLNFTPETYAEFRVMKDAIDQLTPILGDIGDLQVEDMPTLTSNELPMIAFLKSEEQQSGIISLIDNSRKVISQIRRTVDSKSVGPTFVLSMLTSDFEFGGFSYVIPLIERNHPRSQFCIYVSDPEDFSRYTSGSAIEDIDSPIIRYPFEVTLKDMDYEVEQMNMLSHRFLPEEIEEAEQIIEKFKKTGKKSITYYIYELGRIELPGSEAEMIIWAYGGEDRPKDPKAEPVGMRSRIKNFWKGIFNDNLSPRQNPT